MTQSLLELSQEIKALSELMLEIGSKMDYYGGFSEIGEHGREMVNASRTAEGWAYGIANEEV